MNKLIIPIKGMHCRSCELLITEELEAVEGVDHASASFKKGEAVVQFQGRKPAQEDLRTAIENAGYSIGSKEQLGWFSRNPQPIPLRGQ